MRVVVPSFIGARSVEWLANINVQEQPSLNYFQRQAYKLFTPDVQSETADWEQGTMIGDLPLNSLICQPCEGETFVPGPLTISGYAITGQVTRSSVSNSLSMVVPLGSRHLYRRDRIHGHGTSGRRSSTFDLVSIRSSCALGTRLGAHNRKDWGRSGIGKGI